MAKKYPGPKNAKEQKARREAFENNHSHSWLHCFNAIGQLDCKELEIKPTKKTLLMIQMAKDFGFDAYWAGDRAIFGNIPEYDYNLIEKIVDLGWIKELDNE